MSAPLLTVLLPVYDAATWLADAIASVLGQSFGDFELLVIDDGSTDESMEVVRDFRDKRIRIERHDRNRGLIATLNSGIAMARGRLLARMDADDVSHLDRFAVQVEYLDAHPDVAGVSCAYDLIDERGAPLASDWGLFRPADPVLLHWALFFGCYFTHSGAMLRTPVLRACGGFDASYLHAEDYELWLRLADAHRLANVPRVLFSRREHGANVSTRFRDQQWQNAYRSVQASLARVLAREIPLDLVRHLLETRLPATTSATRALAALHGELCDALLRGESPARVRAVADDLAQRLGVLAAYAVRRQPAGALALAATAARRGFAAFARSFWATRRGDPHVYRRSPVFEHARTG